MLPTVTATDAAPLSYAGDEPALPLELIELELSLDGFSPGAGHGFADAVRQAARKLGGDLLFELPASGLADDCQTIAALRIPDGGAAGELRIVLALLDAAGTSIRVENPGGRTQGLKRFADAFVAVLERI